MKENLIIIYHTVIPQPPEVFYMNNEEDQKRFLHTVVENTKKRCKFVVYKMGPILVDFS